MHDFDAIIAGASFAGLTLADHLDGDVLLIDRKAIGSRQTSACATFTSLLEDLGCRSSSIQEFDTLVLHIPDERTVKLVEPVSTFDYEKFCKTIANRIHSKVLIENVLGVEGQSVITRSGSFSSECIIDCTGWRAVLGSSLVNNYVDREKLAFGIESEVDYTDDRLHFFVDPKIIHRGAAWIFPVGNKSRIGIASYAHAKKILPELERFLRTMSLDVEDVHGGHIPFGLREPVVGTVFMVGDSAGLAPPTTGEGIRPAVNFARECARIVQNIIDGDKTLKSGLDEYRKLVYMKKRGYSMLMNMQERLMSDMVPETIKKASCSKIFSKLFQKMYIGI
ncbi:MAG TPA: NAD(P)/FAD-dependent oxidoreductase [Candidatus Methanoperedens sp.]